jgi:hypothetical protein
MESPYNEANEEAILISDEKLIWLSASKVKPNHKIMRLVS